MSTFNIDVEEHRMYDTFDALDNGKNRIALKCVQAAIKKHPQSWYAKAVRALVYHRLGQGKDAIASADEVVAAKPTEIPILNMLLQVYKHYPGQVSKLTPLYEQSWKLHPKSLDHANAVFLSAVRDGDFKKQQSTASSLITISKKSAYSFWRLASLYSNAKEEADPAIMAKKLNMCHIIFKQLKHSDFTMPTQAEFYVQLLEDLGKWDEIAELMRPSETPSYIRALFKIDVEADEKYALALAKLGKAQEAQDVYKKLILNPEGRYNWLHFLGFVEMTVALMKDAEAEKVHKDAVEFLENVQKTTLEKDKHNANRGPFLATIELEKQRESSEESTKLLIEFYLKYIKQFSHKPYCIFDSRPYLEELLVKRSVAPSDLYSQISAAIDADPIPPAQKTFLYAVQRMLGLWSAKSAAELTTLAEEMLALYRAAPNPADFTELALLVHLAFMDLYSQQQQTGNTKAAATVLIEDAAFLESIIAKQENNPQIRLCLLDIYHRLCAFKLQTGHFWNEGFGVKSVLLESCSYVYIQDALRYCNIRNTATNLLDGITAVHHENEANVPDYIIQGYTQQSYIKVAEITAFRAKLRRSALLALTTAELPLLKLYKSHDIATASAAAAEALSVPATPAAALVDNSDYAASLAQHALAPISLSPAAGGEAEEKKGGNAQRPPCYAGEFVESLRAALLVIRNALDCDTAPEEFEKAIESLAAMYGGKKKEDIAAWGDLAEAAKAIFVGASRTALAAAKAVKSNDGAALAAQASEVVELMRAVEKIVLDKVEELKSGDDDAKFSMLALDGIYEVVSALVTQVLSWSDAMVQILPTFLPAKNGVTSYPKRRKMAAKSSALPVIKEKSAELTAAIAAIADALKALFEQMLELPNDAIIPDAAEYPVKGVEPTVNFNSALYGGYRETVQDFLALVNRSKPNEKTKK